MDTTLWSEIQKFNLDNPNDQYGFSTRLAFENNWTLYFTKTAILEYKKFMYLAATYNEMVSPSEIVDIVWHQHLIFTNSYSEFCLLLSKRIEHIPSTHNRSEIEKFQKAKEKTKELYEINFGKQLDAIWGHINEFNALNLNESYLKITLLKKIFLFLFILLILPIYYIAKPILIQIQNPDFLIYYVLLFASLFALSEFLTKAIFNSIFNKIKSSILLNLSPFELIFLEKGKLEFVVHGVVNNLISNKKIEVLNNKRLNLIDDNLTDNQYENCIIEIMKEYEPIPYPQLYKIVIKKPLFEQLQKAVTRIKETIFNSKQFIIILITGMVVLGLALSIGLSRIFSGVSRDKPIGYLLFLIIVLVLCSNFYLKRIKNYMFTYTIPLFFKKEKSNTEAEKDWEWNYFLYGKVILVSSFIPLTNYLNSSGIDSGNSWTSCGNSCGSSCGSSCGGCGGD
ncbi:hypothetical protein [Flavobacterium piscis]|uniref:DUF1399 domain-containing protein n=1 Tax=Flavobacterium piscis TaxID=1114874 RepID=A0ABU1Y7W7_9FLAO|nr:hypothetical protein [Flavobacterium piscis]MDR7210323.1 hypothetical protein [Flavobacterium piscis]